MNGCDKNAWFQSYSWAADRYSTALSQQPSTARAAIAALFIFHCTWHKVDTEGNNLVRLLRCWNIYSYLKNFWSFPLNYWSFKSNKELGNLDILAQGFLMQCGILYRMTTHLTISTLKNIPLLGTSQAQHFAMDTLRITGCQSTASLVSPCFQGHMLAFPRLRASAVMSVSYYINTWYFCILHQACIFYLNSYLTSVKTLSGLLLHPFVLR